MQVFKDFPGRAWPDHGFGKEMQEKALPEPGQIMALVRKSKRKPRLSWPAAPPPSAEQAEQHPDSQASQAASQAMPCPDPLTIFHFSHFNQMKKMKKMKK